MKSQSGQMTVEMVMLAALTVMLVNFVSKKFEEYSVLQEMTLNPWNGFITGMIENGVWGRADQTMGQHPHSFTRHSSVRGKPVQ
jgi:hypothetical protein